MNKQIRRGALAIFSLICIITLVMTSYAYFTSSDKISNVVNIGDVNIEVCENFTSPQNWNGDKYKKIVTIQNKSKSEALIRVAIVPRWVDEDNKAWPGDANIVTLNYANIKDINPTTSQTTTSQTIASQTTDIGWIYGQDGYYYYNSIVPTEKDTVEILDSVSATIPEELKERYKGKTLIVDVKAEAVQATTDAHRATWRNIPSDIQNMLDSLCTR